MEILNLKGHQNRITGSRFTAILLKKRIFPIGQSGEASQLRVCYHIIMCSEGQRAGLKKNFRLIAWFINVQKWKSLFENTVGNPIVWLLKILAEMLQKKIVVMYLYRNLKENCFQIQFWTPVSAYLENVHFHFHAFLGWGPKLNQNAVFL